MKLPLMMRTFVARPGINRVARISFVEQSDSGRLEIGESGAVDSRKEEIHTYSDPVTVCKPSWRVPDSPKTLKI